VSAALIRHLGAEDAAAYRALMLEAYARDADAFTSTAAEREHEPLAWWSRRIGGPGQATECLGAFVDGALAGSVALEHGDKLKTRHASLLVGMVVRPAHRGRGLGGELLRAALAAVRHDPARRAVRLTVTEGNAPAIALYQAHGFVAWGTEPQAILTPRGYLGKVHMRLDLQGSERRE